MNGRYFSAGVRTTATGAVRERPLLFRVVGRTALGPFANGPYCSGVGWTYGARGTNEISGMVTASPPPPWTCCSNGRNPGRRTTNVCVPGVTLTTS